MHRTDANFDNGSLHEHECETRRPLPSASQPGVAPGRAAARALPKSSRAERTAPARGLPMEEYDDTYYAPQITSQGETRTLTFQTRILNQHLICTLCMGYFDEACTIIECLHTFCRSCVMRHFRDSSFCPQCEKNLGPNPVDHVRTDRTLQSIVEKVFPQFSRQPGSAARASGPPEEEEAEPPDAPAADAAEPPRKRGRAAGSGAGPSDAGGESGAGARSERVIGEEISFSLHELEGSATATTPLEKPYLRTKSALTVGHLRKCVHPLPPHTAPRMHLRMRPKSPISSACCAQVPVSKDVAAARGADRLLLRREEPRVQPDARAHRHLHLGGGRGPRAALSSRLRPRQRDGLRTATYRLPAWCECTLRSSRVAWYGVFCVSGPSAVTERQRIRLNLD